MMSELPKWIEVGGYRRRKYLNTKELISEKNLVTVCIEANCPNRYECFSKGTATFMILGDCCTRRCGYCNVKHGVPEPVDRHEPEKIAHAIKELNLNYAVITCVTRDDLDDGGAGQFARTSEEIRRIVPGCKVEFLISDLKGNWRALKKIIDSKPAVLNHNIEVVKEMFAELRPEGDYGRSIALLKKAKEINPEITAKSGFMIGFGETRSQIIQTIKDLKEAGCDIITIGQYLQPSANHFKVKKYYTPEEFNQIKQKALEIGIKRVFAGPLVRSSYKASEV